MSGMPNIVGIAENRFHVQQLPAAVASALEFVEYVHGLAGTPASVSVSIWGTGPAVRRSGSRSATTRSRRWISEVLPR